MNILVMETEEYLQRELLSCSLEILGHTPTAVGTPGEVIEQLTIQKKGFFSFIITNVGKDLAGMRLLKVLKGRCGEGPAPSLKPWESIPFVMVSGTPDETMGEQVTSAGAVAFLRKPYKIGELEEVLSSHCQ